MRTRVWPFGLQDKRSRSSPWPRWTAIARSSITGEGPLATGLEPAHYPVRRLVECLPSLSNLLVVLINWCRLASFAAHAGASTTTCSRYTSARVAPCLSPRGGGAVGAAPAAHARGGRRREPSVPVAGAVALVALLSESSFASCQMSWQHVYSLQPYFPYSALSCKRACGSTRDRRKLPQSLRLSLAPDLAQAGCAFDMPSAASATSSWRRPFFFHTQKRVSCPDLRKKDRRRRVSNWHPRLPLPGVNNR